MSGPLLVVSRGRRKGIEHLVKVSKTWGFCSISKNDGRRGTFEEDLARCISVAGAVQETCSSEMFGGPGANFLRAIAFWSIRVFSFGKMIVRDRCSTSYDLASFSWQAQYFRQVEWKNQKMHWHEAAALHSIFHFWGKSRGIGSFLMLSTSKRGSLAGIVSFWCCQVKKLRKSRRIVSFLVLSSSKIEEVSQISFVFKLVDT